MRQIPGNIIISRTDSIGDVVLTLPVAKVLKELFPSVKIAFLGKEYTRAVIDACIYVNEFIDFNDFMHKPVTVCGDPPECILHVFPVAGIARRANKLNIPLRIGTTNRTYHWTNCNRLVKLSRKKSGLHEAQLNLKLLEPFGIERDFTLEELGNDFGLELLEPLPAHLSSLIKEDRYNVILHPKSQGSAKEWGLHNFIELVRSLDSTVYRIFISGTRNEREQMDELFDAVADRVIDITGTMTLQQFISFIAQCDGMVANSTGPLHIAAALGKDAFGIYSPLRPIHPGRWAPIGAKTQVFVLNKSCSDCKSKSTSCICMSKVDFLWLKIALDERSRRYQLSI